MGSNNTPAFPGMILAALVSGVIFFLIIPGWGKLLPLITVVAVIWALSQVKKGIDTADRRRRR
jgi:hypothetical protein